MTIGPNAILLASAALLAIGAFALIARRNLLIAVFGGQFMYLAAAIAFVTFGRFTDVSSFKGVHRVDAATMAVVVGGVALGQLLLLAALASVLFRERRTFALDAERS